MTTTNVQKVGAFLLKAGRAVYLREIIAGTKLTKNQAAGALGQLVNWDIVEGVGMIRPGHPRRFLVRDREAVQHRVDNPHQHGGGTHYLRYDFSPLIACMGVR